MRLSLIENQELTNKLARMEVRQIFTSTLLETQIVQKVQLASSFFRERWKLTPLRKRYESLQRSVRSLARFG